MLHIYKNKNLIKILIVNEFKKEYLGSYFGFFWAFAQPIVFMLVIWFVFQIGFKAKPTTNGTPFFLWLITGMIPWFFFSDALVSGTHAVVTNNFLVKKVFFRISILPLVQIGSAFIIHFFLVMSLMLSFFFYGYHFSIYWLQLPYYMACSIFLLLGLSWLTSSIRVFVKDIGNFIMVLLQIGFWATPIFWSLDSMPHKYQYLLKLNPVLYIVNGFRDTFINHVWFWQHSTLTVYFLSLSSIIFIIGAVVFRRLRPHFGDVL